MFLPESWWPITMTMMTFGDHDTMMTILTMMTLVIMMTLATMIPWWPSQPMMTILTTMNISTMKTILIMMTILTMMTITTGGCTQVCQQNDKKSDGSQDPQYNVTKYLKWTFARLAQHVKSAKFVLWFLWFCLHKIANKQELGIIIVGLKSLLSCVTLFQNTYNHNIRLKTHHKNPTAKGGGVSNHTVSLTVRGPFFLRSSLFVCHGSI